MAIDHECPLCGKTFIGSVAGPALCKDCSGQTNFEVEEKERWNKLTVGAKLDELKARMDRLEASNRWDGRIG